ncbi:MAG: homoserine dehydrogenase [Deltaproteobacteria bacterium]|nr:homoserine dehydrogenase [Deltaproteobacteria bacterium]
MNKINVGLIGLGTVGTGVVKILKKNAALIARRTGCTIRLKKVADLDRSRCRGLSLPAGAFASDAAAVINDPAIDIVIELIGGLEPARTLVLQALNNGKHVVTANKALLSHHGAELYAAAARHGVDIAFEASVAGGIPIIRAIRDGFASDRILNFYGILNGTSNYILSRMTDEGADFARVLRDAQQQGYAEADPTFDIEGIDALHKLCILIELGFGMKVDYRKLYTEGISSITALDIEHARELGYRIKLLAICRSAGNLIDARVHPTLVPEQHMLAQVHQTFNAIFLQTADVGPTMFYGRGAGMLPTGSAVVADIMALARTIGSGCPPRVPFLTATQDCGLRLQPVKNIQSRYYVRFSADDRPGVLSRIAGVLGRNRISISSVIQKGRTSHGGTVPIFMLTHEARESDMQSAMRQINRLALARQKAMLIRIADDLLSDA